MGFDVEEAVRADAIRWHIRLRDGGDADWAQFEAWLELDAEHVRVFQQVEDMDLELEPLLPELVFREAANDAGEPQVDAPRRAGWGRWYAIGAGALAACVAGVLAITLVSPSDRYEVATSAGENQIVTLDEGTRITLNGSTRMEFDRGDPRFARLLSGEALFHVRHDQNRPFRLKVGDNEIEDVGTVFNVVRGRGELRVSVAEGAVFYRSGREGTPLVAGQALRTEEGGTAIQVSRTPVAAVGAWQRGQLVYLGEPLSQVAADLSRGLGTHIVAAPAIAARPFYGTIAVEGTGPQQIDQLKLVLNVTFKADGDGWSMNPVSDGDR